jgi:hypothetical protein
MLAVVLGVLHLAALDPKTLPLVLTLGAGFAIGTFGHIIKSRTLIVIGIGLIFLATFAGVLAPGIFSDSAPIGP